MTAFSRSRPVYNKRIISVICLMTICSILLLSSISKYISLNSDHSHSSVTIVTPIVSTSVATTIPSLNTSNSNAHYNSKERHRWMTDIDKYKSTNFSLCDIIFKSQILMGAHHKTSTILLLHLLARKAIISILRQKCHSDYNTEYHSTYHHPWDASNIVRNYHLTSTAIQRHFYRSQNYIRALQSKYHTETQQYHYVVLNVIRHPIDTVLSAYNYHIKGAEMWTGTAIQNITLIPAKYNNAESLHCSSDLFLQMMDAYHIRNGGMYSITDLYTKILSLSDGIHFEFERYNRCCFDEIYSSYDTVNDMIYRMENSQTIFEKELDGNLMHFMNFRTEDFAENFNQTCQTLLDKIGVLNVDDRMEFMDAFQAFDLNNVVNLKATANKKHITKGKFNKTQQMEILLNDRHRCLVLKNQTMLLDYDWTYRDFC